VPKMHLTKLAIDRIKPTKDKQVDYHDTVSRGLVLRVNWAGSKSWRVFYYKKRRTQSVGLGRYGEEKDGGIDLKTAREEAGRIRNRGYQKKLQEEAAAAASQVTFKEAAEKWLQVRIKARQLVSEPKIRATLNNTVYPELGERPIEDIKRREYARFLDKIDPDGTQPQKADDALGIIRRVCKYYEGQGDDYASPINAQMRRVEQKETERDRILTDAEIRAFWRSCDKLGPFGGLCQFMLLTAQRRSKCSTAKWADIGSDGVWDIHRVAREKYTGVALKLPKLATDILAKQKRLASNPYIFPASKPGKRNGNNPHYGSFSAFSQGKPDLDDLMREKLRDTTMPNWTLHDLRRTAVSLMSRANVVTDHAERVCGHQIKGVRRRYDRHDFFEQKAVALQKLADLLSSIITPSKGNVVRFKQPTAPRAKQRVRAAV